MREKKPYLNLICFSFETLQQVARQRNLEFRLGSYFLELCFDLALVKHLLQKQFCFIELYGNKIQVQASSGDSLRLLKI